MGTEPTIVNVADHAPEGWPPEQVPSRGDVTWRSLVAGGDGAGALLAGVADVAGGGSLGRHRHAQPEVYFVVEGRGRLLLEDGERELRAGDAVFIPGNAVHGVRCGEDESLRFFYAFPAGSFGQIHYDFVTEE